MLHVSLQAVTTLTELSERTIRRRIADGILRCTHHFVAEECGQNRILICFDAIQHDICLPITADDIELIKRADAGEAAAQTDLAVLFLEFNKLKSAIYWLELSAKQQFADAMHLLGSCYLAKGPSRDENLALMWIAKAASLGHSIAQAQIQSMTSRQEKKETNEK